MKETASRWKFLYIFIIALGVNSPVLGATENREVITVLPATNDHHKYCRGLLELALSYSATNFEFQDIPAGSGGLERELVQLKEGQLDVTWMATTDYLESKTRPIRVPLYRGLLGYRIFLIRKGDQQRFEKVKTLDDLKAFTFGQGDDWPDTTILKANNLKIVPAHLYGSLFYMLNGGRFDAFPRGVHEPWGELRNLKNWRDHNLDLEVEKNLILVYKMPMYMFVSKDNEKLAKTIENGLHKAIDDGSFDRYFFNDPVVKEALDKARIHERKVFHLDNPNLPRATPLDNPKLWWSPTS